MKIIALFAAAMLFAGCQQAATPENQALPAASPPAAETIAAPSEEPTNTSSDQAPAEPPPAPTAKPQPAAAPQPTPKIEVPVYQTLYPSYSPNVTTIFANFSNNTNDWLATREGFSLWRLSDGQWLELPKLPLQTRMPRPETSPPFTEPHTSWRTPIPLTKDEYGNSPIYLPPFAEGTYRLTDKFENFSNTFEITSKPTAQQQALITMLSKIELLSSVTFSPHDFSIPFVYQGVISNSAQSGIKLSLFILPSAAEAQAVFGGITEQGYQVATLYEVIPTFSLNPPKYFDWEDTPHFFIKENIIWLYNGDDAAIEQQLAE